MVGEMAIIEVDGCDVEITIPDDVQPGDHFEVSVELPVTPTLALLNLDEPGTATTAVTGSSARSNASDLRRIASHELEQGSSPGNEHASGLLPVVSCHGQQQYQQQQQLSAPPDEQRLVSPVRSA